MDEQESHIRTSTLFRLLFKTSKLERFMNEYTAEMRLQPFSEYITELCKKQGEVPEHIIRRANLERSYGHQLFRGSRRPSRDTVLQLAFGFNADVEKTQEFLRIAGISALYPKIKRDTAIIYCLHNRFTIMETQRVLHEMELPLIGGGEVK
jgi:transcriptional regulator with XRE-family HTH domain